MLSGIRIRNLNGVCQLKFTTRKLAVIGMLGGISIMLEFGGLGIIQLPFLPVQVTIMHIPTIIGAIVEGPIVGLFIGLIFGGFSMYRAFTQPSILSVAFMNPMVSILPRLAIALTSYYSFQAIKSFLREIFKENSFKYYGSLCRRNIDKHYWGVGHSLYIVQGPISKDAEC